MSHMTRQLTRYRGTCLPAVKCLELSLELSLFSHNTQSLNLGVESTLSDQARSVDYTEKVVACSIS